MPTPAPEPSEALRKARRPVGVRELKAHLSEYIRLASQGETVVVTHRGKDVVVMHAPSPEHEGLRRLMESGMVRWSGGKPKGPTGPPIVNTGEPISKTVLDLRARGG